MPRYAYGWIPDRPDPRDQLWEAPQNLRGAALPRQVSLRGKFTFTPFDQGRLGSCGPQSAKGDIAFDYSAAGAPVVFSSALFTYYNARVLQGTVSSDSGVSNREMIKSLAQFGWCREELWPYDLARWRTKPPAEAYDDAQHRLVDSYFRVPQRPEEMKACLAGGDPFIFGFTVFQSYESGHVEQTGNVPLPSRGERQLGGHDVLIIGYSEDDQVYYFLNSYGTSWGQGGFGTIPFAYAHNPQLASDFWTIRWKATGPAPAPPPSPPDSSPRVASQMAIYDQGGAEMKRWGLVPAA